MSQQDIGNPFDTSIANGLGGIGYFTENGAIFNETEVGSGVTSSALTHVVATLNTPLISHFSLFSTIAGSGSLSAGTDDIVKFVFPSSGSVNFKLNTPILSPLEGEDIILTANLDSSGDAYFNLCGFDSDNTNARLNLPDAPHPDEHLIFKEECVLMFSSLGSGWTITEQFNAASGSITFGGDATIRPDIHNVIISTRTNGQINLYINDELIQKTFVVSGDNLNLISEPIITNKEDVVKLEGIMASGLFALTLTGFDSTKGFE